MKVEFLNPFVYAGMQVLSSEAGVSRWELGKPYLVRMDKTRHAANVVIGVTGAVYGLVIYGMDLAVAKAVVKAMVGAPLKLNDPMAESALGELGNLITGLASTLLEEKGYPCRISPPAIVRGTAVRLTEVTIPMVVVPMTTALGAIHIQLALEEAAGTGGWSAQEREMRGA
ncbi:MAG TPA: chemotaxis protein CheX [Symbiobacteriaceae bacterium]